MEIWGAPVTVCIIMTRDGDGVGATVILMGDADGALVTGNSEGDDVTGDAEGAAVTLTSDSQGVLGKHARPSGHSELLPPGHGLRQLVDAS
jgi:hypothetical protein